MRYFEFREKRDGSSSFCIEGSRQDFADYLSVDKSALSRELNKMKKDGLIDFNGDNFTILQNYKLWGYYKTVMNIACVSLDIN